MSCFGVKPWGTSASLWGSTGRVQSCVFLPKFSVFIIKHTIFHPGGTLMDDIFS